MVSEAQPQPQVWQYEPVNYLGNRCSHKTKH
jgi:hypothetical protein